ncbi:phragmoplast orienting kinesin 1 [Arabidopsis thaliana]|uniref:Kinesin-like protein KIN-12C n=1 Tax=Arabidopsis thaliana TaxID=3702 RepID=KN12C_ARATH|nr:phragmoplast orienting kinesin 1 [Arabidopsis thaliana]Q27IK7.1 RecName: Full=Kinesin-like protein KIN-12C; AltName: Full=Phragmoplast orienting kinesin 1 [Arabidopsis thaliana]ABD62996.1 kinesin POK1 [Arabidopsis thaliana]AEE75943.1 phragmoplast orienting kinesin 1 [Arabidopsis thaliana]|eukprot:NP_188362.2 phragmoplast orienting kinesin 1 [Arabidopsis thaliana]
MSRNVPRIEMPESEENEFASLSLFSPSRPPLNSIPDPSQIQKANHLPHFDLVQKLEGTRAQHQRTLGPEKKFEVLEGRAGNSSDSNPKIVNRNGKSRSEPNSAQSTPTRNGARVSLGGGCATGARFLQSFGGRGRIPRGVSIAESVSFAETTPHFELNEDHSFWKDHNVQVLIRLRPLGTMERANQGYGKCLKQESPQTLVWLGHPEARFTFDHVASETISQEKLFRVAGLPMVENCLSGYNSCVFAYGQTGSGKTYTMMGEISEAEGSLGEDCGVTARIFEYLFSRIKMEEEERRDENLKFSCKCSFLEIYNEQITDLLEPSSTNLQLREDLGKGVYVENLVEHNVRTVSDVLKLLLQGATNRKIAATRMNSESSRSHSVFTCTIESLWEKDSLTRSRFARLNLVDLAGSERQKSSGAEGDRLKEAANINKSLSTLGLVIMSLVDLAHGKHRHVPYRDSRLTFLLQDSLGGNSKTMIIANVSPSLCSTNETLSTLKFAQRAKLIQNNAKVNEDASGDVTALQQEIRKLKVQLTSLLKNHDSCGALSDCISSLEESRYSGTCKVAGETRQDKCHCQVKNMNDNMIGALRREKIAESALQKSEAEIERIDCLVRDMEEDAKRIKIMLNLREEKVGEMEFCTSGSLMTKECLIEENKTLKGEIKLLRDSIDKNPELTRSALENTKLREQLQRYQKFYEHGEREALLAEVTGLRDQLLDVLEAKDESFSKHVMKENEMEKEFEDCRNMNSSLIRELDEIQAGLGRYLNFDQIQSNVVASSTRGAEQAETMPTISEIQEEVAISHSKNYDRGALVKTDEGIDRSILQFKLGKLMKDLEEARTLNCKYEKDHKSQLSQQEDIEVVREQVETETARTILELQEEVIALQSEFQRRICNLTEENQSIKDTITARESEIRALNQDWEKATLELTNFIVAGSKSIKNASTQIESIICSFPQVNAWIGDYVEKAAKNCIKKEETILLLQKSLEDARILVAEMNLKLNSLKGATIALNEFQLGGNAATTEEAFNLNNDVDRMSDEVDTLESNFKANQYSILKTERHAEAALAVTKWLSDSRDQHQMMEKVQDQSVKEFGTLSSISASLSAEGNADISLSRDGHLSDATYPKGDELSTSSSDFSNCRWQHDCALNVKCQGVSSSESDAQESNNKITSAALIAKNGSAHSVYCGEGRQSVEKPLTIMMGREETEYKCSKPLSSGVYMGLMQRMDPVRTFFDRFEEVNATMKEADLTICELVKANEKSNSVTEMWLQTHEELISKEKNLMDDLEQVKSILSACEEEKQVLLNQTHTTLADMENSVSLLEEYFQEMKRGVEETVEALFSHARLAGKELLQLISNSRPSLEQIASEFMEREFTMYATYQCHIGKLIDQILDQRKQVITPNLSGQETNQSVKINAIGYNAEDEVTKKQSREEIVTGLENDEVVQSHESLLYENLYLKKELERKEALFEGLLFDFRLLQESASNKRDIKNEMDELFDALCKVQLELELKASQVHELFVHNENLENCSIDLKTALFTSQSDLEQAKQRIQILAEQNDELRALVSDLCKEKAAAEEGLDEQRDLVNRLEKEILHLTTTAEKQLLSAVKSIKENLKKTSDEKDQIVDEICSLNNKLELAYAIADEKEAIAVEAHQESEASKIYAEQKEEEVKILEISVEELERTINILERRVYDMDEEVKRHRTTQDSLETELQALRQRLFRFENFTGTMVTTNESTEEYKSHISRSTGLQGAHSQIQVLQKEVAEQTKEIKQLKEYISEILLHSEAQSSAYQEKYKTLEVMIRDFKLEDSSSSAAETISHKTEKSSTRSRGSSSPFRCIVGLVQQMKLEKDQELTMARVRVEELESLLAVKQKEICTLNTRIAAADSMTHDVIRDLLGVKMDITSYAELIDQHQVQRVVEKAQQHAEEILSKEQEVMNLKRHIDYLFKDRESCMSELNKKDTDVLATQISLDQLQERVQLLSMQNEMLKNDKSNLLRKLAELDRTVHNAQASNHRVPQTTKDTASFKLADTDYTKRLENAQKLLSHANNELAKYRKTSNNHPSTRTQGQSSGTRYR